MFLVALFRSLRFRSPCSEHCSGGASRRRGFALAVCGFALGVCATAPLRAVDYFYQSGDPSVLGNWNTLLGGGGATPPNFTTATDRFFIPAMRVAVLSSNLTLGAGVLLQVQTGGTLDGQTFAITGGGDFELQAGATLMTAHASGVNGGVVQVAGMRTYSPTANYVFNGAHMSQSAGFLPGTSIAAAQSITVNNQFPMTAGALVLDNNITLAGSLTLQRGTLDLGAGLNHTFNGGANSVSAAPGTIILKRNGTVTAPDGTFQYQTGSPSALLQYNFAGLIFASGEFPTNMPGNVQVLNGTTMLLNGSKAVNGSFSVSGSLNCAGFTLSQNGLFTANASAIVDINGGTLILNGDAVFTAGSQFQDNSGGGGASLVISGSGSLSGELLWQGGVNALANLTMNRAGATLFIQTPLAITGTLSLQQGFLHAPQIRIESTSLSAVQGGSETSFVLGQLLRRFPPNQSASLPLFYPVGKPGAYLPVSVSEAATGAGNPGVVVEARTGLATGTLGAGLFSLSPNYWDIQPAVIGDVSKLALVVVRVTPPLLVPSNVVASANATNGTFNLVNSTILGSVLQSSVVNIVGTSPRYFVVGNSTPVPVITSFSPVTGGTGTVATITGLNLSNASQITFGGTPAQSFEVVSPTTIRAVVANGSTGQIGVVTIGGAAFSSSTFSYAPAPQITGVSPTAGGINSVVSLRGRNLASTASVTFGGNPLLIVFRSDTLVQVRCPNFDVSGGIRLGTPGGVATTTSVFSFLFPPTIAAFSPNVGTQRTVVTITGANFSIVTDVLVGGRSVESITINSPTQISVALLDGSTGTIVVRTPGGEATTATIFNYAFPPLVHGVFMNGLPVSEARAGSTLLVKGQNLLFATRATIGAVTASIVSVLSSTEALIRLPLSGATTAQLQIATPGGVTTASAAFTVLPALGITSVSPISGTSGSLINIFGRGFTNDASVRIAGVASPFVAVLSTTHIVAAVGELPPGVSVGAITLQSTLGSAQTSSTFTVAPVQPVITDIFPLSATFGSLVRVRGQFLTGVREVQIGGGRADIVQSVSSTELIVRVSRFSTSGTMTLTTIGGSTTSTLRMTIIPAPFILAVQPPFTVVGGVVILRGGNFTGTNSVVFGSMSAESFSVLSDTVIRAVVGAGATGVVRISGARGVAESPVEIEVLSREDYERAILRVVYDSLGGVSWFNRATNRWLSANPLSEWTGVTVENGRVTALRLPDNNLRGRLPGILAELTALRAIDLTDNAVSGAFPAWITEIPTLEEVRLGGNEFTGALPEQLGNLPNLRVFVADRNRLSGSLPASVCLAARLQVLNLSQNALSGTLPSCLGRLTNMQTLDLSQNSFFGTIPPELGLLPNLQSLYLHRNQLAGVIPPTFGENLESAAALKTAAKEQAIRQPLRRLWLGGNKLAGEVPESFRGLVALEELTLENNQLFGDNIFSILQDLRRLRLLDLGRNQFSGSVPASIGALKSLRFLALRNNQFSGALPGAAFAELDSVQTIYLDSNQFSGSVPPEFATLRNLQTLGVSFNRFTSLPRMSPLLSQLLAQGNQLQFGDLQANIAIPDFLYAPQDSLGERRDTGIVIGNPMNLVVAVSGRDNLYRWFKNGVEVQAASPTIAYRVEEFSPSDTGAYHCAVTNRLIDNLTLYSRPIYVRSLQPQPPNQAPELVFPHNGANYLAFSPTLQWTRVDNGVRYEVQVSQLLDFSLLATSATARSADTTQTTLSARVENLEPLTLYFWRVRALNGVGVASPWSNPRSFITAPAGGAVTVSSINFGNVLLDSTATSFAFLTNLTDLDVTILDVDGNDREFSFRIPLEVRGLRLRGGQTFAIQGISFSPRSPGVKSAAIEVRYVSPNGDTNRVTLTNALQGRGTPIQVFPVNFDVVRAGSAAQSIGLIANRGGAATEVVITGVEIIGNANGFSVEPLSRPLHIGAGAFSSAIVRRSPESFTLGNVSATIRYTGRFTQRSSQGATTYFDTLEAPVRAFVRAPLSTDIPVRLGVRPVRGQEAAPPGAPVQMEAYLVEGDKEALLSLPQPLSFSFVARASRQVLAFGDNAPPITLLANPDANNRLLRIAVTAATLSGAALEEFRRSGVLARFLCRAVAGDTAQTTVELEYARFGVDTLFTPSLPPRFVGERRVFVEELLAGGFTTILSRAGGERRIGRTNLSQAAALAGVYPQPLSDAGTVVFSIREETTLELILTDIFGKTLHSLAEGVHRVGEYRAHLPANGLPSGTYFVVLRTPAAILSERVIIRR